MTAATACSIRRAGFRLSGRISPEISAHGGSFTYARTQIDASAYQPVSDRVVAAGRVRLGTIVGAGAVRHRAVAALLFGRRRIGARLRLSAARAQGHGRRPDRRPRPCRVRARGAHPPEAVRRQFRGRAVLRRRLADDRGRCPTSRTGASRPAWACVIIRASARSASTSACRSTARRATGRSRSPSRSGRRSSMAEAGRRHEGSEPPPRRLRRDWPRRLLNELFALFIALLFLLAGGAGAARHARRATASSSTASAGFETASGLNIRIGRIDGSIFGKSQLGTSPSPTAAASS